MAWRRPIHRPTVTPSRWRAVFLLVLVSACIPRDVFAGQHRINKDWVDASDPDAIKDRVDEFVSRLREGDTVDVLRQDGSLVERYHLGRPLGEGDYGRVFRLTQRAPPEIIKFAKGGKLARSFLAGEVVAMDALDRKQIPHSSTTGVVKSVLITKKFIAGRNLGQTVARWAQYSSKEQLVRIESLAQLMIDLKNTPRRFTDIHAGNIMFDEGDKTWKVIDPGFYKFEPPKVNRIYEFLAKHNLEMHDRLVEAETRGRSTPCDGLRYAQ